MFKVLHKNSGRVYTVYAVNGPYFMVWNAQEHHWEWMPVENFEPLEGT